MTDGADIQVENGEYVRLHHAILEALAQARLSGAEFRCVMALLRKTYGWNKKEDRISLSQWAAATNTARPHVLQTLNGLVEKRVILRWVDADHATWYGFNKYIEQWQGVFDKDSSRSQRFVEAEVLPEQVTVPKQVTPVTKAGNTTVTKAGNNKRHIKDTVKDNTLVPEKKARKTPERTPEDAQRIQLHKELMTAYRDVLGYKVPSEPTENKGADVLVKGGYTVEQVMWCYRTMKADPFWTNKHLSLQSIAGQIGARLAARVAPAAAGIDMRHLKVPAGSPDSWGP